MESVSVSFAVHKRLQEYAETLGRTPQEVVEEAVTRWVACCTMSTNRLDLCIVSTSLLGAGLQRVIKAPRIRCMS
jgi:hypothetical protein